MKTPASTQRIELTEMVEIRAIHNLSNPDLSDAENEALYGPCFRPHGHHYKVQVTVTGPLSERSGLVFDRDELNRILKENVVQPYDGADLNDLLPNTSCEALAMVFYQKLEPLFPKGALVRVGIQETRKNYFEYPPLSS